MAVTPLNVFTFQAASTVVSLGVSKAFPLPTGSTPTTVIITNMSGEPAVVDLVTAAATTTATQATVGATTITVASASGIAVGQNVIGAGIADGVAIPAGYLQYPNGIQTTTVVAINGSVITLSQPTTAVLSSTAVNFVAPLAAGVGLAIMPRTGPIPLAIGSNTYLRAISPNAQAGVILNVAVGV